MNRGLFALGALLFVLPFNGLVFGQEKDKNTIKALFDGVPADLQSNIARNPVRCDRVNDWLDEHVNGKGKSVEAKLLIANISTSRTKDKTYRVFMDVRTVDVKVLGGEWAVSFAHKPDSFGGASNFAFEGVSMADAEKLVDAKQITVVGKVSMARLSRANNNFGRPTMKVFLEDVQVDGKTWKPYVFDGRGASTAVPDRGGKKGGKKGGAKRAEP